MNKLNKHNSAKDFLIQTKSTLEEELMIDKTKSFTECILRKLQVSTELPDSLLNLFQITCHLFHSLELSSLIKS